VYVPRDCCRFSTIFSGVVCLSVCLSVLRFSCSFSRRSFAAARFIFRRRRPALVQTTSPFYHFYDSVDAAAAVVRACVRVNCSLKLRLSLRASVKLEFHDADTDTAILARILGDTCDYLYGKLNDTPTFSRRSSSVSALWNDIIINPCNICSCCYCYCCGQVCSVHNVRCMVSRDNALFAALSFLPPSRMFDLQTHSLDWQ